MPQRASRICTYITGKSIQNSASRCSLKELHGATEDSNSHLIMHFSCGLDSGQQVNKKNWRAGTCHERTNLNGTKNP